MASFIRNVRATVASRLGSVSTDTTGARFNVFADQTVIEGLRIAFEIVKDLKPQSNKAKIVIYNLSKGTREIFAQKPVRVTLEAGYAGAYFKIYEGDLITATPKWQETEHLTTLQLGTGRDRERGARLSRTYKIGSNPKQIATDLAESMGLKIPKNIDEFKKVFSSGVTLKGPSADQLTKILKVQGMGWSNQDGRLQILRDGKGTTAEAIVVSSETGMIGSPELTSPNKKGQPAVLKVRTILDSEKAPGRHIAVRSRDTTGTYIITKLTQIGDNYAQPWYSDIEAIHA